MKKFGLIGYPISHSFSKQYFTEKFLKSGLSDFSYELFSMENIGDFDKLLNTQSFLVGLNVTIPHKEKIIPLLDFCDELSSQVGAVNTIKIYRNDLNKVIATKGFNTDILGFKKSISSYSELKTKKALVLGTGGASKAIIFVLKSLNISYLTVSRELEKADLTYSEINSSILNEYTFIINCTPVGKFPEVGLFPDLPYHLLSEKHFLYDLIYNPEETEFLKKGRLSGAKTKNGFEMLLSQADASFDIWQGDF